MNNSNDCKKEENKKCKECRYYLFKIVFFVMALGCIYFSYYLFIKIPENSIPGLAFVFFVLIFLNKAFEKKD